MLAAGQEIIIHNNYGWFLYMIDVVHDGYVHYRSEWITMFLTPTISYWGT